MNMINPAPVGVEMPAQGGSMTGCSPRGEPAEGEDFGFLLVEESIKISSGGKNAREGFIENGSDNVPREREVNWLSLFSGNEIEEREVSDEERPEKTALLLADAAKGGRVPTFSLLCDVGKEAPLQVGPVPQESALPLIEVKVDSVLQGFAFPPGEMEVEPVLQGAAFPPGEMGVDLVWQEFALSMLGVEADVPADLFQEGIFDESEMKPAEAGDAPANYIEEPIPPEKSSFLKGDYYRLLEAHTASQISDTVEIKDGILIQSGVKAASKSKEDFTHAAYSTREKSFSGIQKDAMQFTSPLSLDNKSLVNPAGTARFFTAQFSTENPSVTGILSTSPEWGNFVVENGSALNPPDFSGVVLDQLYSSCSYFRGRGSFPAEIRLALNPPELGEVLLRVVYRQGKLSAKIIAESALVKEIIAGNLHELHHRFEQNNLELERIDLLTAGEMPLDDHRFKRGDHGPWADGSGSEAVPSEMGESSLERTEEPVYGGAINYWV